MYKIITIPYNGDATDRLHLESIILDPAITSLLPQQLIRDQGAPKIVHKNTLPLRCTLFNGPTLARTSTAQEIKDQKCLCQNLFFRKYIHESHGHVVTT